MKEDPRKTPRTRADARPHRCGSFTRSDVAGRNVVRAVVLRWIVALVIFGGIVMDGIALSGIARLETTGITFAPALRRR